MSICEHMCVHIPLTDPEQTELFNTAGDSECPLYVYLKVNGSAVTENTYRVTYLTITLSTRQPVKGAGLQRYTHTHTAPDETSPDKVRKQLGVTGV